MTRNFVTLPAFLIAILFATSGYGQTTDDTQPIKVDTFLLNLPIVVNDKEGRNLTDLKKDEFRIVQGGDERPIEFFAGLENDLTVAIIIDGSGSTRNLIKEIKRSAIAFVESIGPTDRCMIVKFDSKPKVLVDLTSDKQKIKKAISGFDTPYGGSNMNDAEFGVLRNAFSSVKGRKAIIVLTDGFTDGGVSNDVILNLAINSDTLIYPVLFLDIPRRKSANYAGIPLFNDDEQLKSIRNSNSRYAFLNKTAEVSGGRLLAAWLGSFDEAFQNIATELKRSYVIGFHPVIAEDGSVGDIKIKVKREGTSIRTKSTIRLPKPDSTK